MTTRQRRMQVIKTKKSTLRLKKLCIRRDSNVMLGQFNPNQLPTLAWALIGFTGLAFCQRSKVEKGGTDITQGYRVRRYAYSTHRLQTIILRAFSLVFWTTLIYIPTTHG